MWSLYSHFTTAKSNASQRAHAGILGSKFLVTQTCRIIVPTTKCQQFSDTKSAPTSKPIVDRVLQRIRIMLGRQAMLSQQLTTSNYFIKRNRARSADSYLQVQHLRGSGKKIRSSKSPLTIQQAYTAPNKTKR